VAAVESRLNLNAALSLLAAAALWLVTNDASAQLTSCAAGSVCYYIAVQPIDVCSDTGTGCAPFNTVLPFNPTVSSTNPIGFVDSGTGGTGKDLTRAMANQIGVDIAWQPMKQYKKTSAQSIAIDSCGTTSCTSAAFAALTQQVCTQGQPCIANGTTPTAPLNSLPTVLNMFFVNALVPPSNSPGTLYGFAWIGNNGIAISKNTFFPPYPLTPRYDTLVHELFHNLGLNHSDSYNYNGTAPALDLMTTGSSRTEPTNTSNAITQLGSGQGAGTADQLDCASTSAQCNHPTVTATPQQGEVATAGFLNPIQTTTTTATKNK
jgi:hypothetical protein